MQKVIQKRAIWTKQKGKIISFEFYAADAYLLTLIKMSVGYLHKTFRFCQFPKHFVVVHTFFFISSPLVLSGDIVWMGEATQALGHRGNWDLDQIINFFFVNLRRKLFFNLDYRFRFSITWFSFYTSDSYVSFFPWKWKKFWPCGTEGNWHERKRDDGIRHINLR